MASRGVYMCMISLVNIDDPHEKGQGDLMATFTPSNKIQSTPVSWWGHLKGHQDLLCQMRSFTAGTDQTTRVLIQYKIKMSSYYYRKSNCGDKTFVRSSYLHNGTSYASKMSSLYCIGAKDSCKVNQSIFFPLCLTQHLLYFKLHLVNYNLDIAKFAKLFHQ